MKEGLQMFKTYLNRPSTRSGHWPEINYTGTQITQWDVQNKGKLGWTGTSRGYPITVIQLQKVQIGHL